MERESYVITDKGPVPRKSEDFISVEIDYHPEDPLEKEIPCGCGANLIWSKFDHIVYTMSGAQVEIQGLHGYKCDDCDLIILEPDAAEPIDRAVQGGLRQMDLEKKN